MYMDVQVLSIPFLAKLSGGRSERAILVARFTVKAPKDLPNPASNAKSDNDDGLTRTPKHHWKTSEKPNYGFNGTWLSMMGQRLEGFTSLEKRRLRKVIKRRLSSSSTVHPYVTFLP